MLLCHVLIELVQSMLEAHLQLGVKTCHGQNSTYVILLEEGLQGLPQHQ